MSCTSQLASSKKRSASHPSQWEESKWRARLSKCRALCCVNGLLGSWRWKWNIWQSQTLDIETSKCMVLTDFGFGCFFNHTFLKKGWPPHCEIMEGMEKCQIPRHPHRNVSFRTFSKAPWRGSRSSRSWHGWKNGWLEVGAKGTGFTQVHLTEKTCKSFSKK